MQLIPMEPPVSDSPDARTEAETGSKAGAWERFKGWITGRDEKEIKELESTTPDLTSQLRRRDAPKDIVFDDDIPIYPGGADSDEGYTPDLARVMDRKVFPNEIDEEVVLSLSMIGQAFVELTDIAEDEATAIALQIVHGESSLTWPPPIVVVGDEVKRFGLIQLSPRIAVYLSKKYDVPIDPGDADSLNMLNVAYFYDAMSIIHRTQDKLEVKSDRFLLGRFPTIARYIDVNALNESRASAVLLVIFHRGGLDPARSYFDDDLRDEILTRLPITWLRPDFRRAIQTYQ